ncbi:MAG TPA: AAA family ATPase [Trinickia sp.]|jgi:predicted ATPase|uniref:AAA family ATPase n=1 Tax=Trinickia sp. TaxID=2571163 RepID=UPI002C3A31E6|nr:AAA family ATPase [Trinickia sp.]HVW51647.1 AAA family ATPase [Trinickia sp.]
MPAIKKLTIAGYKSIRELRDFELRNLNVLIGANGAGKSNFIGFFRMLAEMYEQRLQLYVQRQGGPDALLHFSRKTTDRIRAELYFSGENAFDSTYSFELVPTQDNRLVFADEQVRHAGAGAAPGERHFALGFGHTESHVKSSELKFPIDAQPTLGSWRVYHFHDTSDNAKLKQAHAVNDTLRLKEDGANLAAYLRMLCIKHSEHYRLIVQTIRSVAPFFDNFVHRDDGAETVELEWLDKGDPDTPVKAHRLSDGTLRFMCLATLLLQPWQLMPDCILIDEPELGLHPYAVNLLADLLKRASERKQVIVSTQSVELINCLEPADIVVIDRKDNASTFSRVDAAALADWLEDYSLGELWKTNVLGGRPA